MSWPNQVRLICKQLVYLNQINLIRFSSDQSQILEESLQSRLDDYLIPINSVVNQAFKYLSLLYYKLLFLLLI